MTDVLKRAQAWLDEADKRGINMTDEYGYLAVIRDLSTEVQKLRALLSDIRAEGRGISGSIAVRLIDALSGKEADRG